MRESGGGAGAGGAAETWVDTEQYQQQQQHRISPQKQFQLQQQQQAAAAQSNSFSSQSQQQWQEVQQKKEGGGAEVDGKGKDGKDEEESSTAHDHRVEQLTAGDRHFLDPDLPKLQAIIYAEFDNDIGRVIRFQIPHNIFDKQRFDSISSAIIPSEEMRDRMIKINMFDHKIMGFPVGIKDKKYAREVLIFNMCFIVAKRTQGDWVFEPLVQKCAEYLVELEKERGFLSEEKHRLPMLMHQIFDGLNRKGECIYTVTEQTTLYLKLCPAYRGHEPPVVNPFLVPIFTRIPPPTCLNRMDVLSQKICPQIDGVRCIKDIACAVQIDSDLVARCIRNLCFYGCIRLLPMFLYSNCYVPTEKIRHFFDSPKIIERCLAFVPLNPAGPPIQQTDVCRLYLTLKHGSTLFDWCLRMRPRELNVDERKLIQFGVHYGFLRKTQVFPVCCQPAEDSSATKIASICDGECSLDELALHYHCSPVELHRRLAESGNFRFISR